MLDIEKLELTPEDYTTIRDRVGRLSNHAPGRMAFEAQVEETIARAQLAKALDGMVAWLRAHPSRSMSASGDPLFDAAVDLGQAAHAAGLEWPVKEAK